MEKPFLLHMLTPSPNVSPFDVNMAYDAGFNAVIPYAGVSVDDVLTLTQDAIFSRGPKGVRRTAIFVGGRDALLACDMLDEARKSMVPPFEVSVFADPSGAFTTAAAMLAATERQLKKCHRAELAGRCVTVIGGTGPVGVIVSVLAARAGAQVHILGHSQSSKAQQVAELCAARFGVAITGSAGETEEARLQVLRDTEIALATAKAGVQVLSARMLDHAKRLLVAADVNAVPPLGVEGVEVMDDGVKLPAGSGSAVGIGALAIGNIKYRVHQALFQRMLEADKPVYLDFSDALELARQYVG